MRSPSRSSRRPAAWAGLAALVAPSCFDAFEPARAESSMFIESCSLACTRGHEGVQVSCGIVNTEVNRDVVITFSEPVDPASLRFDTFRILEAETGIGATGRLSVDPFDPRVVRFRPAIFFDSAGAPEFGLRAGVAYRISVPGQLQSDSGPYVRSRSGAPNGTRLDCTIITDQGVLDPVPGPPRVRVFAQVVDAWGADGEPLSVTSGVELPRQPADLVDVHRASPLSFVFADVMNPATLAHAGTGSAPFVRVELDGDGLLATVADRVPVPGRFDVHVDVDALTTEMVFHPDQGYPSAGTPGADTLPRFVVVTLPPEVTDLVGRPLLPEHGGGQLAFVPERLSFPEQVLPGPGGVTFDAAPGDEDSWGDPWRVGAGWGAGRLVPGLGAGAGRLGELVVRAGETLRLSTDVQAFPVEGQPRDQLEASGDGVVVEGGRFEFASLRVESGGRLEFFGEHPARVFVSGPIVVHHGGLVDLSGGSPEAHDSSITLPELSLDVRRFGDAFVPFEVDVAFGPGGPGGGDGGFGADRHDFGMSSDVLELSHPASDARDLTGFTTDARGRPGEGIGGTGSLGSGRGGRRTTAAYPDGPSTLEEESGSTVAFDVVSHVGGDACLARQLGGTGGGGAHATSGAAGLAEPREPLSDYPLGESNAALPTPGGGAPTWLLGAPGDDNPVRFLEGEYLRGGAGGGGGGSHAYWTRAGGLDGGLGHACIGLASPFVEWHDHSGAPGGGGGGAGRFTSSTGVWIDGVVDAAGGAGGNARAQGGGAWALPGGGGAGGGVRVQGRVVELAALPGRVDVSGGRGGRFSVDEPGVRGGAGGVGLVRFEDHVGALAREVAARAVLPHDPVDDSLGWLSVGPGAWPADVPRAAGDPEAVSAATSCWFRPEGLYYALDFAVDAGTEPERQGWNMELEWLEDGVERRVPYRGDNPWYPRSLEEVLGHELPAPGRAGPPVLVRFQGARSRTTATRVCAQSMRGSNSAILEGSETPWVVHPAELSSHDPRPDLIRFSIVLDSAAPAWSDSDRQLVSIRRLWVRARPQ